jgi:hypothetical protein
MVQIVEFLRLGKNVLSRADFGGRAALQRREKESEKKLLSSRRRPSRSAAKRPKKGEA